MSGDNVLAYAQLPSGPPGQMQLDSANNLKVTMGGSGGGSVAQGPGAGAGTAWRVEGDFLEQSGSGSALNAIVIGPLDVSIYKSFSLDITGTWSGVIRWEASNGNVVYTAVNAIDQNSALGVTISTTYNSIFTGPLKYRYFRVRLSGYSSGTVNIVAEFHTEPAAEQVVTTVLGGGTNSIGTVQPGNTANTTPWLANPSGCTYAIVPSNASDVTVKGSAGVYYGAKVSAVGANPPNINDSSNTIDVIPASSAIGFESVVPAGGVKFATSLVVKGSATNPNLIVYYL